MDASEFVFVIEGAQVCAQSMGTANAGERLLRIVRRLLEEAPRSAAPRR